MTHPLTAAALVGIGGFAGSIARYSLSLLGQRLALAWPGGTFAANLAGCFIIGVIAAVSERSEALSPQARLLLATGFCGGFTTMSSLVYETMQMLRSHLYLHAAGYLGATVAGSLLAFIAGALCVRLLVRGAG